MTSDQTLRQRSSPIPFKGPEQINLTYDQVHIDKMSEKFPWTLGLDHGNTRHKTVLTPQPPMFVRDEIDFSKSYHMVKGEESNINGNSEKDRFIRTHY